MKSDTSCALTTKALLQPQRVDPPPYRSPSLFAPLKPFQARLKPIIHTPCHTLNPDTLSSPKLCPATEEWPALPPTPELARSCTLFHFLARAHYLALSLIDIAVQVKGHIWVFVNCLIENPAFDSQTKAPPPPAPIPSHNPVSHSVPIPWLISDEGYP